MKEITEIQMKEITEIHTNTGEILVDIEQAARRIGVSRSSIYTWAQRGWLEPRQLGSVRLYELGELQKASRIPIKRKPRGVYSHETRDHQQS